MNNRFPYIAFFVICSIITTSILISDPSNQASYDEMDDDKAAIVALFSVPGSASTSRSASDGENSFFEDSSFMNTGVGSGFVDEEANDPLSNNNSEEPDILEPVNPNNPKNPQTGQPYSDAAMKKFVVLRKRFPGNNLIPSTKNEAQKAEAKLKQRRTLALSTLVIQGNANEDEVNEYYDLQAKSFNDRRELLGYVFETMADRMSDDIREQYKKVRKMNERQIKELDSQRQASLKIAK